MKRKKSKIQRDKKNKIENLVAKIFSLVDFIFTSRTVRLGKVKSSQERQKIEWEIKVAINNLKKTLSRLEGFV